MNHSQKHGTRLLILFSDIFLTQLHEGNISGNIALNEDARSFIDNQKVIVFVNHLKRLFHPEK